MRATTVESRDSQVLSAVFLRCRIVLLAEIEPEPSQQSTQVAERLVISRGLDQRLDGSQNQEGLLVARQGAAQVRTVRKEGCPSANPA